VLFCTIRVVTLPEVRGVKDSHYSTVPVPYGIGIALIALTSILVSLFSFYFHDSRFTMKIFFYVVFGLLLATSTHGSEQCSTMDDSAAAGLVTDLVFGRWKTQITHTAVELGIFESMSSDKPKTALEVSREAEVDPEMAFRLLRAVSSLGLLIHTQDETKSKLEAEFRLTPAGALLRKDHPQSMADIMLLENGETHYNVWKHLTELVRDGETNKNGFVREYGRSVFEFAQEDANSRYAKIFNNAMQSISAAQVQSIFDMVLQNHDYSSTRTACDIGGGTGFFLSYFLSKHKHANGIVFDLPYVAENKETHVAKQFGVEDRVQYLGGDMFAKEVPAADTYFMKYILHDWNDTQCVEILRNTYQAAPVGARLFICDQLVSNAGESDNAKIIDIHMGVAAGGMERTSTEFRALLEQAGWNFVGAYQGPLLSVVEAVKK
jgi:hypothetical protein